MPPQSSRSGMWGMLFGCVGLEIVRMSSKTAEFDEFVKRQRERARAQAGANDVKLDPKRQLVDWLDKLEVLYSEISGYLEDYSRSGSIEIVRGEVLINEDFVGPYKAPKIDIIIGSARIQLIPIGTWLVGSKGRVDVKGPAGECRLLLINRNVTKASELIQIQVRSAGDPVKPSAEHRSQQSIEWVWKIVSRPPVMTFADLDKEAFLQMILEVSGG